MRNKRLVLIVIILSGFRLTGIQAQSLYVKQQSGSQSVYTLDSLQKITFSNGNACVKNTDGSTDVFSLCGLEHLSFSNLITGIVEQATQSEHVSLLSYPNPVSDFLNVDLTGTKGEGIISIISLEGKLLLTQNISSNSLNSINLSDFPNGIYICRYSSTSEILQVKIIKQ